MKLSVKSSVPALFGVLALILTACSASSEPDAIASSQTFPGLDKSYDSPPPPELDTDKIASGATLYAQYCASCHMPDRSGAPNWKTPNEAGIFPPPPHDVTGHTWHHSDDLLLEIVTKGLDGVPSGMPRFEGVLSDDEILSILEYFKSEWGDEERAFQWQVTWQGNQ